MFITHETCLTWPEFHAVESKDCTFTSLLQYCRVDGVVTTIGTSQVVTNWRPDYSVDGDSALPDAAERKTASITAIFLIASSRGTGTAEFSMTALEKASTWMADWSQMGKVSAVMPPPKRSC